MGVQIDKITVTFYGETECNTATKFRNIVEKKHKSMNEAIKVIILEYIDKNKE